MLERQISSNNSGRRTHGSADGHGGGHHGHGGGSSSSANARLPASRLISIPGGTNPVKENPANLLLDYSKLQNQFMGARFIFECGIKLEAAPLTLSTATILFHRFFQVVDEKNYDIYLIGSASLYLAGKVESQQLKIRDILNVSNATIHRGSPPLDLNEKYWALRESVVQAELLMMRTLSFQVRIEHPHKYLVHYLKTLENWIGSEEMSKVPIARTAWAILQDFHHDSSILSYTPQALAIAAIEKALLSHGCTIPLCSSDGKNSWQRVFYQDFDRDRHEEIMTKMLRLYEMELGVLSKPELIYQNDAVKI